MDDEEDENRVCHNCIGEAFLSERIQNEGVVATCHYCGDDEEETFSITELADEVEGAFARHFERTSPEPSDFEYALQRDKELDYEWDREGEPVLWAIAGAAEVREEIAQDVLEILEERNAVADSDYVGDEEEFGFESHYEEKRPNDFDFRMEWDAVERSIKQRTRFFNRDAEKFFARLFADLDKLTNRQGLPVLVKAGPNEAITSFFRARAFHNVDDGDLVRALARPDRELGSPPPKLAKLGRMNAQGISVFYGASDAPTALAEIRPPVGSRVLVGRFDLTRPVRLLDVEALQSVYVEGSFFDPAYLGHLELSQFLGRLSARMTMPVMPDDEPTEYLITQMIADFVAQCGDPPIDGMLYRSVQCAGEHKNVVLFNHAACVAEWDIPADTDIDARTFEMDEDGGSINYWVSERVPAIVEDAAEPKDFPVWAFADDDDVALPADGRDPTLKLEASTLQVHHVTGVTIQSEPYDVRRHRYEKTKRPKFARPDAADDLNLDF